MAADMTLDARRAFLTEGITGGECDPLRCPEELIPLESSSRRLVR